MSDGGGVFLLTFSWTMTADGGQQAMYTDVRSVKLSE